MEPSILKSVKKNLGLESNYTVFDHEIIMYINGAFSTLNQLGLGPNAGYSIEDELGLWVDFGSVPNELNAVKNYVYLRVRLIFDPPTPEYVLKAFESQLKELEWRLNTLREGTQWADPSPPVVIINE